MYQNKITLMPRDILEKEFKIDTRGYRLKEVDQFLDIVIGDYEQFFEIINNLEKEKADLLAEIMNLKQELRNSKLSVEVASNSSSMGEVTNVDVIRRLSQLEKMVYGLKASNEMEEKEEPKAKKEEPKGKKEAAEVKETKETKEEEKEEENN